MRSAFSKAKHKRSGIMIMMSGWHQDHDQRSVVCKTIGIMGMEAIGWLRYNEYNSISFALSMQGVSTVDMYAL